MSKRWTDRMLHVVGSRRCSGVWVGVVLVVLFLVGPMVMVGCQDPVERYHTLSMFFDGVPPPEGIEPPPEDREFLGLPPLPETGAVATTQAATQPAQVVINYMYHAPYETRKCFSCHDQQKGFQIVQLGGSVCQQCHAPFELQERGDWFHGPVSLGECQRCHESHRSQFKHLTRADQPQLCNDCHGTEFITSDRFHASMDKPVCSNCHDPHVAGNRMLLADSRTYARRARNILPPPQAHATWLPEDCKKCHTTGKSNQVIEKVNEVCLTCHAKVRQNTEGLHKPVLEGKCISCHTPHRSIRPHLIRPTAEKLCLSCHKTSDYDKPDHPKFSRADCLLCHQGHSSSAQHLVKPTLAAAKPWPIPPRPTVSPLPTTSLWVNPLPATQPSTPPIVVPLRPGTSTSPAGRPDARPPGGAPSTSPTSAPAARGGRP